MLPRIQTANARTREEAAPPPSVAPQRTISSASAAGPQKQTAKDKKKELVAVRDAWNSAPTAHDVLLQQARQELANQTVMRKILVAPPSAPRAADALQAERPSTRPSSTSSIFSRRAGGGATDFLSLESQEAEKRCALLSREVWELEVIGQMAQVHYVNNIMTPLLDRFVVMERETRCTIRAQEAAVFSEKVMKSSLYARLRQMKAERDRDERRKRFVESSRNSNTGGGSETCSTPDEAERILREYRQQFSLTDRSPSLPPSRQQLNADGRDLDADDESAGAPAPPPRRAVYKALAPIPPQVVVVSTPLQPNRPRPARGGTPALTLVQLRHMLDEITYTRRVQAEEEQQVRSDIEASFAQEKTRVQQLADRRQHLERLIYWRQERETKQQHDELMCLFAEQQDALSLQESTNRREIDLALEATSRIELQNASITDRHRVERLLLEQREALTRSHVLEVEQRIQAAMTLVVFHEEVERHWIVSHLYATFHESTSAKREDLLRLAHESLRVRKYVLVIQRSFRLYRLGLLGWKRTHRSIGFFIQKRRAEKLVVKNREALTNYKDEILAELQREADQQNERTKKLLRVIEKEEKEKRETLRMDEALDITGSVRKFRNNFIKTVFLPQLAAVDVTEHVPTRLRVAEGEEEEWDNIVKSFAITRIILRAQHEVKVSLEPNRRSEIESEAFAERSQIVAHFSSEKLGVIEIEERRAKLHGEQRAQVEVDCLAEHTEIVTWYERDLDSIFWAKQCHHLEVISFDSSRNGRSRLIQVFFAVLLAQHDRFATHASALVACELFRAHNSILVAASASLINSFELEERVSISESQSAQYTQIVTSEFAVEYARIEAYMKKRNQAAGVIQRTWKSCVAGLLGRTATLSYLRTYFWSRREKAFLRQAQESTKRAVLSAKEELEREIASHNLQTASEYAVLFAEIENRIEPRRRDALFSHENFIRQIHYFNFDTLVKETIRTATEELREHESYHRVKMYEAFENDYRVMFTPMKNMLVFDVSARPIQRAWRCHKARSIRRRKIAEAVFRVVHIEEVHGRTAVELEWIETLALGIVKPQLLLHIQPGLFQQKLHALFQLFCFGICRQGIIDEEWRLRINHLWILQQHERYDLIEHAEAVARRIIFDDAKEWEQAVRDVLDFEGVLRQTQQQERSLFLLRVLASMELQGRAATMEDQILAYKELVHEATSQRDAITTQQANRSTLLSEETAQRSHLGAEAECARQRLHLECDEAGLRIAILAEESRSHFSSQLVAEEEACWRRHIALEQRLFAQIQHLDFNEASERCRIEKDWGTKLIIQSGPVLRAVEPFRHMLVNMEEEQREMIVQHGAHFWTAVREEKEKSYSSSIRAGAVHMLLS